jgi:hypothetical protein
MWEPRRLTTLWASTACYRDSLFFLLIILYKAVLVPYDFKLRQQQLQRGLEDGFDLFL